MSAPILSKSKLIAYRQCPRRLWLEVNRPELRQDSATTLASFQVGYQVGDVARRIYDPEQRGSVIDIKSEGFGAALRRSERLLQERRGPVFEAGFRADGVLALADVLLPEEREGRSGWRMIEVKSSTSVKDYHRDDAAIQAFAAKAAGVELTAVAVACIDSTWVYPGDGDYRGLLVETDLTEEVRVRAGEVSKWVEDARGIAMRKEEPDIEVGDHCTRPFACGFCQHCASGQPQPEYPLDFLPALTSTQRGALAALGVTDLRQAPDELLNPKQRRVKQHTRDQTTFFDAAGAAAALRGLEFPLHFLDFETAQFAVPVWRGTRPYQQIPFQFSLHRLAADGRLSHVSHLDLSGDDPSAGLARALVAACGEGGTVLAYNASFEATRLSELAARFPEQGGALDRIRGRIVDLLPITRENFYHPSQNGSWSIKAVLPAVAPDLSYAALAGVNDGAAAVAAYHEAINPATPAPRKQEIAEQLTRYCELDTLGLVRLWEFLTGGRFGPSPRSARSRNP